MRKIFLIIAIVISLFSSEYTVDKEYSSIKFEANKMFFVGVSGEFSQFSGRIKLSENNKLSQIDGLVLIDSINTANEERDEHLKAKDYFEMEKFPNILFKSNTIIDDTVKATVSIKGIKKELEFKISDYSVTDNSVTFKLSSTVDRRDFLLIGPLSAIIADNVDVVAKISAVK